MTISSVALLRQKKSDIPLPLTSKISAICQFKFSTTAIGSLLLISPVRAYTSLDLWPNSISTLNLLSQPARIILLTTLYLSGWAFIKLSSARLNKAIFFVPSSVFIPEGSYRLLMRLTFCFLFCII
jgi:hypothetical protein